MRGFAVELLQLQFQLLPATKRRDLAWFFLEPPVWTAVGTVRRTKDSCNEVDATPSSAQGSYIPQFPNRTVSKTSNPYQAFQQRQHPSSPSNLHPPLHDSISLSTFDFPQLPQLISTLPSALPHHSPSQGSPTLPTTGRPVPGSSASAAPPQRPRPRSSSASAGVRPRHRWSGRSGFPPQAKTGVRVRVLFVWFWMGLEEGGDILG